MNYLIGDLQGCCDALDRLLAEIGFSPSRDRVHLLGDLVNRGPASLATLRRIAGLGDAAVSLLGNHDLHLLAVAHGAKSTGGSDTLEDILNAPDRTPLIDWLRHQHLAVHNHGWLMVHAGVAPQWTLQTALQLADELHRHLRGNGIADFLRVMYGNEPARWNASLQGDERLRFAVNAFTRVRFVHADGTMDFKVKEGAEKAPLGLMPWFDAPGRSTAGIPIAFGHWSTLGLINRPDLLSLDTGCVWGGKLTAVRIDDGRRDITQVQCEQMRKPG